jgi:hypothetical protein
MNNRRAVGRPNNRSCSYSSNFKENELAVVIDVGRCCGIEMNVEKKTKVMRISRQSSPVTVTMDQNQLENVKYFKYLRSMLTDDGRCTCEIKSRIAMTKATLVD